MVCSLHKKTPIRLFICFNLHLPFLCLICRSFQFFFLLLSWTVSCFRLSQSVNIFKEITDKIMFFLPCSTLFFSFALCFQDFPLLQLGDVVNDQSNIVGFSMLNRTHPFYLEFIRSLNLSWKEGCNISPYPGPAVRQWWDQGWVLTILFLAWGFLNAKKLCGLFLDYIIHYIHQWP